MLEVTVTDLGSGGELKEKDARTVSKSARTLKPFDLNPFVHFVCKLFIPSSRRFNIVAHDVVLIIKTIHLYIQILALFC